MNMKFDAFIKKVLDVVCLLSQIIFPISQQFVAKIELSLKKQCSSKIILPCGKVLAGYC